MTINTTNRLSLPHPVFVNRRFYQLESLALIHLTNPNLTKIALIGYTFYIYLNGKVYSNK